MSVIRVGSTTDYALGWENVFGKERNAAKKSSATKKRSAKKAAVKKTGSKKTRVAKKKVAKKEKSVAEEVKCEKCGGAHPTDECPNILEREEIEVDGELIILEKIKMDEGLEQARDNVGASTCWKGYKAKGTKKKGGKEVPNCVKEEEESIEEAKKGLYANIHAKRKRGESPAKPGSEDYPAKDAFKKAARTAKKEEVEYTTEKKLDPVGKEDKDVDNDGDHDKSDKYLLARRKKVGKIIAMSKKK